MDNFISILKVPGEELPLGLVTDIIDKMPKVPDPDALGLNENSAALKDTADTENLLRGVVLTSPIASSGKGSTDSSGEAKESGSTSKDATSKVDFTFQQP